ncbi:MAG: hypothetical protein QXH30_02070 [Candidatus Bilamarchaeaceae archaeon]
MATKEVRQFERRVGPAERPAMPPVNGFAKRFAPEGMKTLGTEGPAGRDSGTQKPAPRGYNMELGGMAPPSGC